MSKNPTLSKIAHARGKLDVNAFVRLSNDHPAMLLPVFIMRSTLRKNILGGRHWDDMAAARHTDYQGAFYHVDDILQYSGRIEDLREYVHKEQAEVKR